MKLHLRDEIGSRLAVELDGAEEARIAVAYFIPDDALLQLLERIPRLTLVISDEFTLNDPYKLEHVARTAEVRTLSPSSEGGKLHAKVIIVTRRDGSTWAQVGSANLTWQALHSNREACVALDSRSSTDESWALELATWFDETLAASVPPDWATAKRIFDTRSRNQLVPRTAPKTRGTVRFWTLKTTSGSTGEDHWPKMLAESVLALGWSDIEGNPADLTHAELLGQLRAAHRSDEPQRAARKIRTFIDLRIGDIVLVMRGYVPNQKSPVHVYAVARVTGEFREQTTVGWAWRFKHDAVIQPIDSYFPKALLVEALGMGSMRQAIHEIPVDRIARLESVLGIRIEV